jgi:oxygen-independent coproporphyrinogen-3 oxidase
VLGLTAQSVYIHIPFCRAKCAYCDFDSFAGLEGYLAPYVAALVREIESFLNPKSQIANRKSKTKVSGKETRVSTVYFGGGTPSLLSLSQVQRLLGALDSLLVKNAEVTLEANPGTVDYDYLRGLRGLGVNRLSLGVQSFDDALLRAMGRIHSAREALEAYYQAREAGFDNVNLDLIYGLPGPPDVPELNSGISGEGYLARWNDTLSKALALQPDHLSLYALTLEPNTPMGAAVASGQLSLPDEDLVADMYVLAEELLEQAGYVHYEISNWAHSETKECRHNLTYWRNQAYVGFGAGAHSYLNGYRYHNVLSPLEYIARLERGESPVDEVSFTSKETEMAETMMLGLRLTRVGVRRAAFRERFGQELDEAYAAPIQELVALGLLEDLGEAIRLTPRGRLLGNEAFARFL